MARLRPATIDDVQEMVSWFQNVQEARAWSGPDFEFPCDLASFARQCRLSELNSWVLRTDSGAQKGERVIGFGQYYERLGRCHLAAAPRSRAHLKGSGRPFAASKARCNKSSSRRQG